jgi:hypothetical protein
MAAVLALTRAEVRRAWRQLLLFAVVVAIGTGSVLLASAGARRADSAYGRFRDAVGDGNTYLGIEDPARFEDVRDLPMVEAVAPFGYVPIYPKGAPTEAMVEGGGFVGPDGRWLYDVQRPRVLEGAMPPAEARNQMAVNEEFTRWFDVDVGDVVPMEAATTASMAPHAGVDEVTEVDLEVAAVVRAPMDIGVNVGGPTVYLPPGVVGAHDIGVVPGFALVVLTGGDADIPGFERAVQELFSDGPGYSISSLVEEGRTVERANDVQTTALFAVAAVSGLATLALVAQLASRGVRRGTVGADVLRSLGASRAQRVSALALPMVVAMTAAVIVAAVAAMLLSPLLPRGLARLTEPDPGIRIDPGVIATGVCLAWVLFAGVVGLAAGRATAPVAHNPSTVPRSLDRATNLVQRGGAHLPLLTGLRLAMPSGRRDGGRTGLGAYAGLGVGIAGLLTATAFGAELDRVSDDSGAWGAPFELMVGVDDPAMGDPAAAVSGVERVTVQQFVEEIDLGTGTAPGFGLEAVEGDPLATVVTGRAPSTTGEALLGVRTAADLDLGVDDSVRVTGGGGASMDARVVGLGLVPITGDNTYDAGVVLGHDDFRRLELDPEQVQTALLIDVADGADMESVSSEISDLGMAPSPSSPPGEQINLRSTLAYPRLVGLLVAVLAVAGVASALLSGASSRRLELAVLRAIGFTPGQVRASIRWQALAVSALGLLVAVPLGLIAARTAWGAFARTLSIAEASSAWWVVAPVVIGAVLVAAATAIPVGRHWSRRRLSDELRVG